MSRVVAVVFLVILAGCSKPTEHVERSSNAAAIVERVTTWDDCALYRIKIERTVYVARCGAGVVAYEQHSESCGKHCSQTVRTEAQTVEVRR
jgi:hypothetical protein